MIVPPDIPDADVRSALWSMTNPTNPMLKVPMRPSGAWVAFKVGKVSRSSDDYPHRFVGVFDTCELAQTACAKLKSYIIANVEPNRSYLGRIIDWRLTVKATN